MKGLNDPFSVVAFIVTNFFYLNILLTILCIKAPFMLFKRLFQKQSSDNQVRGPALKAQMKTVEAKLADGTVNKTPRDTVLLMHGFPDSGKLWDGTVERLTREGYRCLVVSTPGSMGEEIPRTIPFDAIVEDLNELLGDEYKSVTVLAHDWGCAFAGLLLRKYPERVRRFILLDVGNLENIHWLVVLAVMSYQFCFIASYYMGHPLGTFFVKYFLRRFRYDVRPLGELRSDMTWPYASFSKSLIQKKTRKLLRKPSSDNESQSTTSSTTTTKDDVQAKISNIPKMFLYGAKKAFYFHDDEFLDYVRQSPNGFVKPIGCGHWISHEAEEEYLTLLTQWLNKSDSVEHTHRPSGSEAGK